MKINDKDFPIVMQCVEEIVAMLCYYDDVDDLNYVTAGPIHFQSNEEKEAFVERCYQTLKNLQAL